MHSKQMKFENPVRIEELKPAETLKKIGMQDDHVVCDIGAGSGVFTIPAAKLTKENVYALDINEEMLALIGDKARHDGIENIQLVKVNNEHFDIPDKTADIALLVAVLHEITDRTVFVSEIKRLLKDGGKVAVIEFHKRQTTMGPPVSHRLGQEEVLELFTGLDFILAEKFELGENYYCSVFQVNQ